MIVSNKKETLKANQKVVGRLHKNIQDIKNSIQEIDGVVLRADDRSVTPDLKVKDMQNKLEENNKRF